jgi:hypothetical protein
MSSSAHFHQAWMAPRSAVRSTIAFGIVVAPAGSGPEQQKNRVTPAMSLPKGLVSLRARHLRGSWPCSPTPAV